MTETTTGAMCGSIGKMPDAISRLLHLRAVMVRLAADIEKSGDLLTGKGAPRARATTRALARKLRDEALAPDMVEACKRWS